MAAIINYYFRASLNDFLGYVRCPQEDITISYKPKSFLRSLCCAAVVSVSVILAVLLVGILLFICFPSHINSKLISDISIIPCWIVIFLGPIVEELLFRLSLVRKKVFLVCSLTLLCFTLVSKFAFTGQFYSIDHIWLRVGIAILAGTVLFLVGSKWLTKCDYRIYFYGWAFLFGTAHLSRIDFGTLLPLDFITIILYVAKQSIMGLLWGYVRMKNGIVSSILLHILNNATVLAQFI